MRIIYTMNRRLACKRLITKMDATNNHARIIHKGDTIESKDLMIEKDLEKDV